MPSHQGGSAYDIRSRTSRCGWCGGDTVLLHSSTIDPAHTRTNLPRPPLYFFLCAVCLAAINTKHLQVPSRQNASANASRSFAPARPISTYKTGAERPAFSAILGGDTCHFFLHTTGRVDCNRVPSLLFDRTTRTTVMRLYCARFEIWSSRRLSGRASKPTQRRA